MNLLVQCGMYTKYEASKENIDRAIESLADESEVLVDIVASLYNKERVRLEVGARITGFISILAIRNVRKLLRGSCGTPENLPALPVTNSLHRLQAAA